MFFLKKTLPVGWEKLKQRFLSIFSNLCGDSHRFFLYGGPLVSALSHFLCLFSGTATSHVCCVICTGGFPVSISARFLRLFSGTATLHVCCVICTGGTSGSDISGSHCGGNRCAFPTLLAIFFFTGKHPHPTLSRRNERCIKKIFAVKYRA